MVTLSTQQFCPPCAWQFDRRVTMFPRYCSELPRDFRCSEWRTSCHATCASDRPNRPIDVRAAGSPTAFAGSRCRRTTAPIRASPAAGPVTSAKQLICGRSAHQGRQTEQSLHPTTRAECQCACSNSCTPPCAHPSCRCPLAR
jgi:hypothetical protein